MAATGTAKTKPIIPGSSIASSPHMVLSMSSFTASVFSGPATCPTAESK